MFSISAVAESPKNSAFFTVPWYKGGRELICCRMGEAGSGLRIPQARLPSSSPLPQSPTAIYHTCVILTKFVPDGVCSLCQEDFSSPLHPGICFLILKLPGLNVTSFRKPSMVSKKVRPQLWVFQVLCLSWMAFVPIVISHPFKPPPNH